MRFSDEAVKLLCAKLEDAAQISHRRPHFIGFLDESQLACAKDYLKNRRDVNYTYWGGFETAERVMLGFFPDYMEKSAEGYPIKAITARYRDEDILSHKDFLGSFMALGIQRSVIGDILPDTGRCVVFVREEIVGYILQNIRLIGRTGVKLSEGYFLPLPAGHKFQEITGVVTSERLDCIVSLLGRISRDKAAGMIRSSLVMVNHREVLSGSVKIAEGDILSIRKKGRYIVDKIGPVTAKGRLSLQCRKYD